jgi:hypothetical protein
MSMRKFCSRQCNIITLLRITFSDTIYYRSNSNNSSSIPTPNRIKQSIRIKKRYRQNTISPLLHYKRHCRIRNPICSIINTISRGPR